MLRALSAMSYPSDEPMDTECMGRDIELARASTYGFTSSTAQQECKVQRRVCKIQGCHNQEERNQDTLLFTVADKQGSQHSSVYNMRSQVIGI